MPIQIGVDLAFCRARIEAVSPVLSAKRIEVKPERVNHLKSQRTKISLPFLDKHLPPIYNLASLAS
jgi:hypothetical protein